MFQIEKRELQNPLESHYKISNKNLSAKIYPNLGASLQELISKNVKIIKGFEKVEDYKTQHTSSVLFPFPGRIEHGKYTYKDKQYQLDTNEQYRDNAIHGLVAHQAFELKTHKLSSDQAYLKFAYNYKSPVEGYPFLFRVYLNYTITQNSIRLSIEIENLNSQSMPFGIGWHPYFHSLDLEQSVLCLKTSKEIECNQEMIPLQVKPIDFNNPLKIEGKHFDTCYIIDTKEVSIKTNEYIAKIEVFNQEEQYLQIFTPASRNCIAIEPMSCAPNAFNNQMGLLELKPYSKYFYDAQLSVNVL